MYKILIKGYFKNCELNEIINYNNEGYLINNIITFKTEDTEIKLNVKTDKIKFVKDDKKSNLTCEFILKKNTVGKYKLKKENIIFDIPVYTNYILKKDKSIKIEYDISDNKNILYIDYEVIT